MNKFSKRDIFIFYIVIVGLLINNFFENYCANDENRKECREFLLLNRNDPPQSSPTSPDLSLDYTVAAGTTASTVSVSEIFNSQNEMSFN